MQGLVMIGDGLIREFSSLTKGAIMKRCAM